VNSRILIVDHINPDLIKVQSMKQMVLMLKILLTLQNILFQD